MMLLRLAMLITGKAHVHNLILVKSTDVLQLLLHT